MCATKNPVNLERPGGGRVECWLVGSGRPDPGRRDAAARAGGADRCRRSLTRPTATPPVWWRSATSPCTSSCAAATLSRLFGRDTGTIKAVDGVNLDAAARRGRRAGRRERQRQVHAGPGAARPGARDRAARSTSATRTSRRPEPAPAPRDPAASCRWSSRTRNAALNPSMTVEEAVGRRAPGARHEVGDGAPRRGSWRPSSGSGSRRSSCS